MEVLLFAFSICALTATSYDCDKEWIIEIYEGKYVPCTTKSSIGCALYNEGSLPQIIRLGNDSLGVTDEYGNTNLQHEIKHVLCKCNWHNSQS